MVTVTVFGWPGTVSTFRDVPVPVRHFGQASVMGTALSGKREHDAVTGRRLSGEGCIHRAIKCCDVTASVTSATDDSGCVMTPSSMIAPTFVVHGVGDGIWLSVRTPKPLAPATRELVSKWWTSVPCASTAWRPSAR